MDVERRLSEHLASDEAALADLQRMMRVVSDRLTKIETNHLAHMEPDIRETKQSVARIEASLERMAIGLQRNNEDTQQVKLDMANLRGDLNTKIAALDASGVGQKSATKDAMAWMWDLLKIMIGGMIAAAMGYFAK